MEPDLDGAEAGLGARGSGMVFMTSESVRKMDDGFGGAMTVAILPSCGVDVDFVTCLSPATFGVGVKERIWDCEREGVIKPPA